MFGKFLPLWLTYIKHCASVSQEKQLSFDLRPFSLSLSLSLSLFLRRATEWASERATNHNLNSAFPKMAADILAQRFARCLFLQIAENSTYKCGCHRSLISGPCLSHFWCASPSLSSFLPVLTLFDGGNCGTHSIPHSLSLLARSLLSGKCLTITTQ